MKRRRGLGCPCGATASIRGEVDPNGSLPDLPLVPEMDDLQWRLLVTSILYRRTNKKGDLGAVRVDWTRAPRTRPQRAQPR